MSVVTWRESFPPKPAFSERDIPDQQGRVFIVTGGSSGCGYEVAKAVYNLNGRVYMAGRSAENAQRAIQRIKSEAAAPHPRVKRGRGELLFLRLDLSDLSTIKGSAEEFLSRESRLDVIWHNAGLGGASHGSVTAQGLETHLGVNAVGPFLFQHFLTPTCLRTASRPDAVENATRVVWVTSSGHRGSQKPDGVNWEDMNMHDIGGVRGMIKYPQSKAMCAMFAHELARRHGPGGLVSLSLHPGSLRSKFQRHQPAVVRLLTSPLLYEQHYGGLTELFAGFTGEANTAMMEEEGGRNGAYVEPWGRWGSGAEHVFEGLSKRGTGARLWAVCDEMVKDFK